MSSSITLQPQLPSSILTSILHTVILLPDGCLSILRPKPKLFEQQPSCTMMAGVHLAHGSFSLSDITHSNL